MELVVVLRTGIPTSGMSGRIRSAARASAPPPSPENAGICQNVRECAGMLSAAALLHCTQCSLLS
jgi:hypothetical protein